MTILKIPTIIIDKGLYFGLEIFLHPLLFPNKKGKLSALPTIIDIQYYGMDVPTLDGVFKTKYSLVLQYEILEKLVT